MWESSRIRFLNFKKKKKTGKLVRPFLSFFPTCNSLLELSIFGEKDHQIRKRGALWAGVFFLHFPHPPKKREIIFLFFSPVQQASPRGPKKKEDPKGTYFPWLEARWNFAGNDGEEGGKLFFRPRPPFLL